MDGIILLVVFIVGGSLGFLVGLAVFRLPRKEVSKLKDDFNKQFELLASKALTHSSERLRESSEHGLKLILNPFKERIQELQKRVDETYQSEARERFALKHEIQLIAEVNKKMSEEAHNLTRALKGDVKAQGNWGEIILERILESSGLRADEEYILQGKELGLESEEGKRQKPDVIIKLPDDKHLIVDSKVVLTSYERYVSAGNDAERALQLKDFNSAVYQHVDMLSSKHYQASEKLNSPDLVFLFLPIEAAFSLLLQTDQEIFHYAWSKRIVIVAPTTLLATLRTVASIWRTERQNKNALEIARQAGGLYDKFKSFLDDLLRVDRSLQESHKTFSEALAKLSFGKGSLVSRVERLKDLGAKTSKQLDKSALKESEDSDAEPPSAELN